MKDKTIEEVENSITTLSSKIKLLQDEMTVAAVDNPEELSLGLMKLGRLNSALGRHAAYAEYIARNADRAARRFRANKTLEASQTQAVNKSELQAEIDSEEVFTAASYTQLVADQAKDLSYRTDTFLKMSQSRFSLIKGDLNG